MKYNEFRTSIKINGLSAFFELDDLERSLTILSPLQKLRTIHLYNITKKDRICFELILNVDRNAFKFYLNRYQFYRAQYFLKEIEHCT